MNSISKIWTATVVLMVVAIVALNALAIWRITTPKAPESAPLSAPPEKMAASVSGDKLLGVPKDGQSFEKLVGLIAESLDVSGYLTPAEYAEETGKRRIIYDLGEGRTVAVPLEKGAAYAKVNRITFLADDGVILLDNYEQGTCTLKGFKASDALIAFIDGIK